MRANTALQRLLNREGKAALPVFAHSTSISVGCILLASADKEANNMGKVKRLTLDRYEHGLLVRALYEE